MPRVLLAGVSTRAMAASAVRSGFGVVALDAFGDLDQPPEARVVSVPGGFSSVRAAQLSRDFDCDGVAYLAGFENHPDAVEELARGRALWGNPPEVLRRVRDPLSVSRAFRGSGHAAPEVRLGGDPPPGRWLVKPLARGGGHGIRFYECGLGEGFYLQEFVEGVPASVVFVANGRDVRVLGVSRQLIGDEVFGAYDFQYCGSILDPSSSLRAGAEELAKAATRAFGLDGVNGIDFVLSEGVPWPVEINPRWTASVELVEDAWGFPVFTAHHAACDAGVLPEVSGFEGVRGKAIVFACQDLLVGDTENWHGLGIRDIPRSGQRIARGRPICTVLAGGTDESSCRRALVRKAAEIHEMIATFESVD